MDGKYLASNIGPLKVIGDGKPFTTINDLLNSDRFENVRLVAYSISGHEKNIVTVECLFEHKTRKTIYYRDFDFYKVTGKIEDSMKMTADYGIGFADFDIDNFIKLRDFYFQHSLATEIAQWKRNPK